MNFNISSENLNNPLLKEILIKLTDYFQSINSDFYVIGATARDIILNGIYNHTSSRRTVDLDIAVAIKDWGKFGQISRELCEIDGFQKSEREKQLFIYKNIFRVDIVPFGEIATADIHIYWPPQGDIAMSVVGFIDVANKTLSISIDNEFTIKIASLPGICILKIIAFNDRKLKTNKDADDLAFILENYLEINQDRAVKEHYEIYEAEHFDTFTAGAILMGYDIKSIFGDNEGAINTLIQILEVELKREFESPLINQMIETHKNLKFETILEALKNLHQKLKE